jgi:uncharacterized protein YllA (UPF0747 family)
MTDVRIATEPLGGSPLSRYVQRGDSGWGDAAPRDVAAWRARAEARLASGGWRERLTALAPAFAATGRAAAQLDRIREGGGIVVTTGQQPGLFGGPVYTWSKAVGALALAEAIERSTGIPTVAVYWAATDDADFAEAASTVVHRTGGVDVLRATAAPPTGTPMSRAALGDIDAARRGLREACGSAADPRPLAAALAAYGDDETTAGDAFVALLREYLAPLGMPVLDASHEAVRLASAPLLREAGRRAESVERALAARTGDIHAAGFMPQVEDVGGLSLVFVREDGLKRRLPVAEAGSLGSDAILTPNVLLRPIVEGALLPTVAYVAGPGELAYFAQVGPVAEALGVHVPLAVPRWSCTLVEPTIDRLLARYGTSVADLEVPHALEGRLAREAMSGTSATALASLRAAVRAVPDALAPEAAPLGLDRAVLGAVGALHHRIDRLERRLVAGIKRRELERMRDVATLRGALFPLHQRQERTLNVVPFLARHGLGLLDEMRQAAAPHAAALVGEASALRRPRP